MPRSLPSRVARSIARRGRLLVRFLRGWVRFTRRLVAYRRMAAPGQKPRLTLLTPSLLDDRGGTPIEVTYFFQDAWAFQKIASAAPERHVDVGSHHKFVSLLAQVVPTTMVDIRPLPVELWNLDFKIGSAVDLPFEDQSVPSVSSICVLEHIGLGRYGDALDPDGTTRAAQELKRIVAAGGDLYVSLPLDDETRTYFDAHRSFTEDAALALFAPFEIVERRYIYGDRFVNDVEPGFGTGCYHFRAPSS